VFFFKTKFKLLLLCCEGLFIWSTVKKTQDNCSCNWFKPFDFR